MIKLIRAVGCSDTLGSSFYVHPLLSLSGGGGGGGGGGILGGFGAPVLVSSGSPDGGGFGGSGGFDIIFSPFLHAVLGDSDSVQQRFLDKLCFLVLLAFRSKHLCIHFQSLASFFVAEELMVLHLILLFFLLQARPTTFRTQDANIRTRRTFQDIVFRVREKG